MSYAYVLHTLFFVVIASTESSDKAKGRQFVVGRCAKTQHGTFSKYEYKNNPYQATVPYLKRQPLNTRKLGFGSRNATVRDEFTSYIRTQQYREQLKVRIAGETMLSLFT